MKKFSDWDWRIKILGPIFYSIAISGFFVYNFLQAMSLEKFTALVIIVSGYTLMVIARFQLKDRFSIRPEVGKGLITSGLYRRFRHPVYLFSCVAAAGICLYIIVSLKGQASYYFYLMFAVYAVMQFNRAKEEELLLLKKYKHPYLEYKKRTIC